MPVSYTHLDVYKRQTVDTLSYLKKGGRITPAAAAIGDILNIRPVLQIQGGKIDAYSKVRGRKKSKQVLVEAIQKDMRERFGEAEKGKGIKLHAAYAGIPEEEMCIRDRIYRLRMTSCVIPGHFTIMNDDSPK